MGRALKRNKHPTLPINYCCKLVVHQRDSQEVRFSTVKTLDGAVKSALCVYEYYQLSYFNESKKASGITKSVKTLGLYKIWPIFADPSQTICEVLASLRILQNQKKLLPLPEYISYVWFHVHFK